MDSISKMAEEISRQVSEAVNMVGAISKTIGSVIDFFTALTAWLGFPTIAVLFGFLFCYKIFQALFPSERLTNLLLALLAFSALWITWNLNYYREPRLLNIGKTYGFIGLHIIAFYLIHDALRRAVILIRSRYFSKSPSREDTLRLFEIVDHATTQMKEHLKNGEIEKAAGAANTLQQTLTNTRAS